MREIKLVSILALKRREKGITQQELATYAGVSKASVSKWETGQSYPDVTLLPQLASYFDLSIDALMGYTPQMDNDEIEELYQDLASDFAERQFEEVINKCNEIKKKYYSCYPLLMKLVLLYINHASLIPCKERRNQLVSQAIQLCDRIREHSKDVDALRTTTTYQAMCFLLVHNGKAVLELLGESVRDNTADGLLIAQAYRLLGNNERHRKRCKSSYTKMCDDDIPIDDGSATEQSFMF